MTPEELDLLNTPLGRGEPLLHLDGDADDVGRGLARLVVALLEIVRELLERQAIRRVDAGGLSDEEVERLGMALLALKDTFAELRARIAPDDEDPDDIDVPPHLLDALLAEERHRDHATTRRSPA